MEIDGYNNAVGMAGNLRNRNGYPGCPVSFPYTEAVLRGRPGRKSGEAGVRFKEKKEYSTAGNRLIYCHCTGCGRLCGKIDLVNYLEKTCEKCGTKMSFRSDETGALVSRRESACA